MRKGSGEWREESKQSVQDQVLSKWLKGCENRLQKVEKKCVRDLGEEKRESPVLKETDRERRMLSLIMRLSRVKIKTKTGFDGGERAKLLNLLGSSRNPRVRYT